MRRYWIQKSDLLENSVLFQGEVFHHIFDVCRQSLHSEFEVLTEDAKAYLVVVDQISKKEARATIKSCRDLPPLPTPHIHLVICISRFPVMDAIFEKAVEIGVKSIQPVYSEHSFLRKNDSISPAKIDRWQKIIKSATQQSGRGDLLTLGTICNLNDFVKNINRTEGWAGLFAYEGTAPSDVRSYLQNHVLKQEPLARDIWIFVGSEGGFSSSEVLMMEQAGLKPVTLGSQVLRVETACVTLVSILKYAFDLWK